MMCMMNYIVSEMTGRRRRHRIKWELSKDISSNVATAEAPRDGNDDDADDDNGGPAQVLDFTSITDTCDVVGFTYTYTQTHSHPRRSQSSTWAPCTTNVHDYNI